MSWLRFFMIGLLLVSLSSCGFEPLYDARGGATKSIVTAYTDIALDNIPDRDGQYLRNALIDRLYLKGDPVNAPFLLKIDPLKKSVFNIGIRKDATATRAQIQISTQMRLVERTTGKILLQRDLKTVGAYNLLDNQLATLVSQNNITDGLLDEMGDNAVQELNLYLRRQPL